MCGCEHHWNTNAACSCTCPSHEPIRREMEHRAEMDRVRAEAWDQGYRSGHSNAMRQMSDEPNAPTTPNPYRATASPGGLT